MVWFNQHDHREREYTVYSKYTDEVDSVHKSRSQALLVITRKEMAKDWSWRIRTAILD